MIEYIGKNSIKNLQTIIKKYSFKNIFLVTGKKSFEISKAKKIILNLLKDCNITRFFDFSPNPKIEDIKKGLELFKKGKYNIIIAVGGGSVIDIAKSIAIFSTNNGMIEKFIKKEINIEKNGTPLICIPTTAGSGSQATHFAVIYINKIKYSLGHTTFMLPDYSIVDPQFTYSLPPKITASTGMDALSQAIESYWNINSTKESKKYAEKAIKLVVNNLVKAVNDLNKESRRNMSIAAHYAGKAINISKTTACHAISYPITSYFNVSHGHAVALTLPSMFIYNSKVNEIDILDPRGLDYVKKTMKKLKTIIGVSTFLEAKQKIEQIMLKIGLEIKLNKLGIKTQNDIELIIKNGFNPERVKNNPRKLTEYNLRNILEEIK